MHLSAPHDSAVVNRIIQRALYLADEFSRNPIANEKASAECRELVCSLHVALRGFTKDALLAHALHATSPRERVNAGVVFDWIRNE
jgi:hypothetical protein